MNLLTHLLLLIIALSVVGGRENEECRVFALFPFTKNVSRTDTENTLISRNNTTVKSPGFSHMASYLMAVEHFNNRDASVVQELENFRDCNVKLNISGGIWDSESSSSTAVAMLMKMVYNQEVPDLVFGGYYELPVNDLSVVTSGLGIPYMAYGSSSLRVVTPFLHPFATRTSVDKMEIASRVLSYLNYQGRTDFISIFHATSDSTSQMMDAMVKMLKDKGVRHFDKSYTPPLLRGSVGEIQKGLANIRDQGFRTIILIVDSPEDELPVIAQAADEMGMNDGSYFYAVVGSFNMNFFETPALVNEPVTAKLLRGAAVVCPLDGFEYNKDDKFLAAWRSQNETLVTKMNEVCPLTNVEKGIRYYASDYFQTTDPEFGSSFVYDAVMATGMGLCAPEGDDWVTGIRASAFQGATGKVSFGGNEMYPGGRTNDTATFGVFNLLPPNAPADRPFTLTEIFAPPANNPVQSGWQPLEPFIFADGATSPPPLLRTTPEQNYLSQSFRIAGFFLFGLTVVLVLSSSIWVYLKRNHSVLKAAQPFFLQIIILGCLLVAFPIFTNSWDESYGWTEDQLAAACTSNPWLITLGTLFMYCSIASKLWRVNSVLSFRRKVVKIQHVVWPSAFLIFVAIVLLTLWTVLEGFSWVRIEIDEVSGESIGKCQGVNSVAWFTPIFLLVVIPFLLTFYMAYKTNDVDSSYAESLCIYVLLLIQFQMLVVSIPVLTILEMESTDGRYIGQVMIFCIFAISPILLLVVPKVRAVHGKKPTRSIVRGQRSSNGTLVTGVSKVVADGIVNRKESRSTVLAHTSSYSAALNLSDSRVQSPLPRTLEREPSINHRVLDMPRGGLHDDSNTSLDVTDVTGAHHDDPVTVLEEISETHGSSAVWSDDDDAKESVVADCVTESTHDDQVPLETKSSFRATIKVANGDCADASNDEESSNGDCGDATKKSAVASNEEDVAEDDQALPATRESSFRETIQVSSADWCGGVNSSMASPVNASAEFTA